MIQDKTMAGAEEAPPARRIRGKSTVRGRSPNPKSLKKAAKAAKAKENKGTSKKVAEVNPAGFVTPPPKGRTNPGDGSSSSASKEVKRKIVFGENTTHPIEPENPGTNKDMKLKEAEEIWKSMTKDPISVCVICKSTHRY